MPSIRVKRTATNTAAVPNTLLYGELGIAKDHLYFGKYSKSDSEPAAPVEVIDRTHT